MQSNVFELNVDSGNFGSIYYPFQGPINYFSSGYIEYSGEYNTIYSGYYGDCANGGNCKSRALLQNLDNNLKKIFVFSGAGTSEEFSYDKIVSFGETKLIYIHINLAPNLEKNLYSIDYETFGETHLCDFVSQGEIEIPLSSTYLESINKLVKFNEVNNEYIVFDFDTFSETIYSYPNTVLSNIIQIKSGRVFAIKDRESIVEINPLNGETIELISNVEWYNSTSPLSYSESTGRFFWVNSSTIHIYSLEGQTESTIVTQENIDQIFTDY